MGEAGATAVQGRDPTVTLAGIRLETRRVEVRLTRAAVRARLFRGPPEATRIGRFVVLERVGMGGMGIVYAAYDPQLDRRIALKVMRDDVVRSRRERQQQQLLREARAMAKLSHPNVVAVYDAGTVDDQVFVAMEFVPSQTLRAWSSTPRETTEILRVFTEAGRGLAGAHAAGLVHRDFKPENVLVPAEGAVRVTDFGIARAVERSGPARSGAHWRFTSTTATAASLGTAGTPAYMAPEQMRGGVVDARADQWAFCVALYEALHGGRPWDAEGLHMLARGETPPLPPLRDDIDAAVRSAIERGLAIDPADRFDDMNALLARLRPRRRRRGPVVAGVAAAVAGAAALVVLGPRDATCPRATEQLAGVWDEPTRARATVAIERASPRFGADAAPRVATLLDAYAEQWLDLRQGSCRAADSGELSAELLDLRIACLDTRRGELAALTHTLVEADAEIVAHAAESALRLTAIDGCADPKVLRELTPPPPPPALREASREIRARVERARALRRAGKPSDAAPIAAAAVHEAEALDESTAWIDARLEHGRIAAQLADREGAAADFDAVIERGASAGYLSAVAEASVALVDVVGVDLARHEAGLDLARMAAVAVALAGDPRDLRAQLGFARGRVLYLVGRTDEALVATDEALDALAGPTATEREQLERASGLRLLAKLTLARDDPERTRELAEAALAIFEELLGPRHPEVADARAHLGAAALRQGRIEDARRQFTQAAEIQREAFGDDHPTYARTLANLGSAIRAGGDPTGALARYHEAVAILERSLGAADPRVATLWVNIGGVEADLDHPDAAEVAYRRGLEGLTAAVGASHPQTALALANLGRLQLARGDVETALASLQRALEIREASLGADHIETARSRMAWGEALAANGDTEGARAAYDAGIEVLTRAGAPQEEIAHAAALRAALDDPAPAAPQP